MPETINVSIPYESCTTTACNPEHKTAYQAGLLAGTKAMRASVCAWLRVEQGKGSDTGVDYADGFADQIEQMKSLDPTKIARDASPSPDGVKT